LRGIFRNVRNYLVDSLAHIIDRIQAQNLGRCYFYFHFLFIYLFFVKLGTLQCHEYLSNTPILIVSFVQLEICISAGRLTSMAVKNNAVVIDLSGMKEIHVDQENKVRSATNHVFV